MDPYVIVVLMQGGSIAYEKGSSFRVERDWVEILGPSRTPIAAFAAHRVVRVFYSDSLNNGPKGIHVVASTGL